MATNSSIEWTEATWNPVVGCAIISPGCTNCYAMRMARRLEMMGQHKYTGTTRVSGGRPKWNGVVRIDEGSLLLPMTCALCALREVVEYHVQSRAWH